MPAGPLPLVSPPKRLPLLRVLPLALARPTSDLCPPFAHSDARLPTTLSPPANLRRLPLAHLLLQSSHLLLEAPPPRSAPSFSFRRRTRRRRTNSAAPRQGQWSSRKRPLFLGTPLPCGIVASSSGPGKFSGFLPRRLPRRVRKLRGYAGSHGGAPKEAGVRGIH